MNNQTTTLKQEIKKLLNVPDEYLDNEDLSNIEFGIKCANWQKEQDEAKYKALLDSHNELLQMLFDIRPLVQPAVYCKGDDFMILKGRIDNLINKAKNIN